MRQRQFLFYRVMSFAVVLWLAVGFETSFWPRFVPLSPPVVWVSFILFMSFYGERLEGVLLCYIAATLLCGFTSMPWGTLSLIILSLYFIGRFLRVRFFWSGSGYFMIMNAVFVLLLYLIHTMLSALLDPNPVSSIEIKKMIVQMILTPAYSYLAYKSFDWLYKRLAPDSTYVTGVAR